MSTPVHSVVTPLISERTSGSEQRRVARLVAVRLAFMLSITQTHKHIHYTYCTLQYQHCYIDLHVRQHAQVYTDRQPTKRLIQFTDGYAASNSVRQPRP